MHWETDPLVNSHQTGREKKSCWGFYSLKQTEGSRATCFTSTQISLHLWGLCSTATAGMWIFLVELVKRRGASFWDSSTMNDHLQNVTYTRALKRQYGCNLYNRASTRCRHLTLFLSESGMWGILAWPFDCKKEGFHSKEQRQMLGVMVRSCFDAFFSLCV